MVAQRTRKKLRERSYHRGQLNPAARLTDGEIEQLRQLHEQGIAQHILAEKFEVSRGYVSKVVSFKKRQRG